MSQPSASSTELTTPQAADAFVSGLSAEAKRAVLASLLRAGVEAVAPPADPADWRTMKVVPPLLSAEEIAELRALDPNNCVDAEEFFSQLDREDRD